MTGFCHYLKDLGAIYTKSRCNAIKLGAKTTTAFKMGAYADLLLMNYHSLFTKLKQTSVVTILFYFFLFECYVLFVFIFTK